ncbi:MAG: hypothetical protein KDB02_14965 [Acidimicrobiales bacterium]|nr:hypothetical protein [Acidimicrobiales bacterium]
MSATRDLNTEDHRLVSGPGSIPDPPPSAIGGLGWIGGVDRRRFLLGSSTAVIAFGLMGCSRRWIDLVPGGPGGHHGPGGSKPLPKPGTPGLMDERVFQSRADGYLAFATSQFHPGNPTNVIAHLERSRRDRSYRWDPSQVTVEGMTDRWKRIDGWQDTRDFDLMYLFWLLHYGRGRTAMTRLDPAVLTAIEDRLIANRYRYDDPLPDDRIDNLWFWSENHIIINLALEFLAGERFSRRTFTVTGMTGAQHAARAREGILEWISERIELGFFEWHSNVYMLKNITPLLMLVELSRDREVVAAAAVALDLCFLDMAAHNHAGCYTAPRGRTYKKDKMSSLDEATFGTAKFLFDDTEAEYQNTSDGGATYLAVARHYRPPQALVEIAKATGESVVRERHGVYFDGGQPISEDVVAPYGKDFDDRANLAFWWSLGAIGMWPLAKVGVDAANEFRLWDTELFAQVKLMAALNGYDPVRIRDWLQPRSAAINFGFLSEANTYAYRNDRVSMATVLDHRPGEMRDQAHAWVAAIDENAMVFTNHPVTDVDRSTDWRSDGRPGYWTGEASMPRSAQFERTSVHIYLPKWDQSLDPLVWAVFAYRPYTHAYVPQDHFDRVVQEGNWTIAERKGAYIGLWSWRTPTWRVYDPTVNATRGMSKPFDLVAGGGADNLWIAEVGTIEVDGTLEDFVRSVTANVPTVVRDDSGFSVAWASPSSGPIEFSSTGAFLVSGVEQPLGGFPRHQSRWGTVDHLATRYSLESDTAKWSIDKRRWTRKVGVRRRRPHR